MNLPVAHKSAMKTLPFILFALAALALAACVPMAAAGGAGAIYETRPGEGPPADTADAIPPHESWCYETAGYPECYSHPVPNAGNRLINVDPANRYPLTAREYYETTVEDQ